MNSWFNYKCKHIFFSLKRTNRLMKHIFASLVCVLCIISKNCYAWFLCLRLRVDILIFKSRSGLRKWPLITWKIFNRWMRIIRKKCEANSDLRWNQKEYMLVELMLNFKMCMELRKILFKTYLELMWEVCETYVELILNLSGAYLVLSDIWVEIVRDFALTPYGPYLDLILNVRSFYILSYILFFYISIYLLQPSRFIIQMILSL